MSLYFSLIFRKILLRYKPKLKYEPFKNKNGKVFFKIKLKILRIDVKV